MPAPHPARPDSGLTVQLGGPSHIAGSLWARNPPGAAEGHPATRHPLLCPQLGGSDPRWAGSQDLLCCPNWVPAFALQCRADRPRAKDLPSLSRSPSPHHTTPPHTYVHTCTQANAQTLFPGAMPSRETLALEPLPSIKPTPG